MLIYAECGYVRSRCMLASLLAASTLLIAACATGGSAAYPAVSADGLQRIERSDLDAFYVVPGAALRAYRTLVIGNCSVAFRDNWLRDQNRNRLGPNRVTTEDVERIAGELGVECREVLSKELQERGYALQESGGDGVLKLQPAIVKLDVYAPDIMAPGRSSTFVTMAGEMTLELELRDGASGEVLGRIIDRQRARDINQIERTDRVANRAEAQRMLRRWATQVANALAE